MKTLLTLLLAICAATGYGQTIKALGYNTTNGVVAYSGTNTLKFENNVVFDQDVSGTYFETVSGGSNGVQMTPAGMLFLGTAAATTLTNLGLGATWLTNANVTNFRSAIGLPLPALTNASNVTTMRALAGSTNTNAPYSGVFQVSYGQDVLDITVSNGIILFVEMQ
jgi:hypothetical protein